MYTEFFSAKNSECYGLGITMRHILTPAKAVFTILAQSHITTNLPIGGRMVQL